MARASLLQHLDDEQVRLLARHCREKRVVPNKDVAFASHVAESTYSRWVSSDTHKSPSCVLGARVVLGAHYARSPPLPEQFAAPPARGACGCLGDALAAIGARFGALCTGAFWLLWYYCVSPCLGRVFAHFYWFVEYATADRRTCRAAAAAAALENAAADAEIALPECELSVCSWNLRNFGGAKMDESRFRRVLVLIEQHDLIVVQELRGDSKLIAATAAAGGGGRVVRHRFVGGRRTGDNGRLESSGVLYDAAKLELVRVYDTVAPNDEPLPGQPPPPTQWPAIANGRDDDDAGDDAGSSGGAAAGADDDDDDTGDEIDDGDVSAGSGAGAGDMVAALRAAVQPMRYKPFVATFAVRAADPEHGAESRRRRRITVVGVHVRYGETAAELAAAAAAAATGVETRRQAATTATERQIERRRDEIAQVAALCGVLRAHPAVFGAELYVCGDFNVEPDDHAFWPLRALNLRECLSAAAKTTVGERPRSYDNVWLPASSVCARIGTARVGNFSDLLDMNSADSRNNFKRQVSDHLPVCFATQFGAHQ